jgi:putative mRNA 3-end processing factor
LKYRLGNDIKIQPVEYGEDVLHNGAHISFHPAGHIIGSSQIRVESNGEVWVASGDYKTQNDGITTPFELVKCHAFISESTFGLPVFQWKPQQKIFDQINSWWKRNQSENVSSVLICYALGKAQRILYGVDHSTGPIFAHGAIENINEIFRKNTKKEDLQKSLVLATNSVLNTAWLRKMAPYSIAYASGWMQVRGNKRRRAADIGFALSDHADWNGLNETIKATGAEKIFITHGYTFPFVKWLREKGWDAEEEKTEYVGELAEESAEEEGQ